MLAVAMAMMLMALTLVAGARGAVAPVKNPDTLVVLAYNDPQSLDPAYAYDTASDGTLWPQIYETLITYDGSVLSKYVPRLARQVPSVTNGLISKDGLSYTFPIRPGVRFHDGSEMTPDDVRYSMLRFMLQDRDGGPSWLLLAPLVGRDTTRDGTKVVVSYEQAAAAVTVEGNNVVFHLHHAYAPFLSIIAAWSFVLPRKWAVAHGDWDGSAATWQKYTNPIHAQDRYAFDHTNGTGPFRLQRWDRQARQVILVRNAQYWRKLARLGRVVIRIVDEFTTRRLALQQGDADIIQVDRPNLRTIEGLPGVTIRDGFPGLSLQALYLNQKIDATANPDIGSGRLDGDGIPPDFFSDVHVRRAFAYAFDYRTFIRDAYRGRALQPSGPIIAGLLGYDPAAPKYAFGRDKAVAEFRQAWGGKLWDAGFRMTATYNTGNAVRQIAMQIVKDNVESLNPKFKIDVRNVLWSAFLDLTIRHKGTLFAYGWVADYPDPDDFAQPFLASRGDYAKRTGFYNQDADRLVKQGAETVDPGKRVGIYKALTALAFDTAAAIYIAQPTRFVTMRSWVHGFYYNAILPPLVDVGLDFYPMFKE